MPKEAESDVDEFYDQAVAFVTETRRASISSVQRHLRVGYNRAARIIEEMEVGWRRVPAPAQWPAGSAGATTATGLNMRAKLGFFLFLAVFAAPLVQADGSGPARSALETFTYGLDTFQAGFTQTVRSQEAGCRTRAAAVLAEKPGPLALDLPG